MSLIKIPRKLKKKIISFFGRGTYLGIIKGFLIIKKYKNNTGCIIKRTTKTINDSKEFYYSGQYNPYITFQFKLKNIK